MLQYVTFLKYLACKPIDPVNNKQYLVQCFFRVYFVLHINSFALNCLIEDNGLHHRVNSSFHTVFATFYDITSKFYLDAPC